MSFYTPNQTSTYSTIAQPPTQPPSSYRGRTDSSSPFSSESAHGRDFLESPHQEPHHRFQEARNINTMMPGTPYPGGGMGMAGMGVMNPGMGQSMPNPMSMNPIIGNTLPGYQPGQAYTTLPYEWTTPRQAYEVNPGWNGFELASAHYNGGNGFERSWFDNMEVETHGLSDLSSRVLGGAAAMQAFLIWDKDHYSLMHSAPSKQNEERLVGLAVAELYQLFDKLGIPDGTPAKRGKPLQLSDAVEVAAATARHLFEQHYDGSQGGGHHRSQSGSERERERREERARERMMRGQHYGGGTGYGQQLPPFMGGGYHLGTQYGHQGHHSHHGAPYTRGYERGGYDSDDEGEGWDRSRMRGRNEGLPGGGGMYGSTYGAPGMGGMMNPMMNGMVNGMRSPPPTMGYGAASGMNQMAMPGMQPSMIGGMQGSMAGAGMMNGAGMMPGAGAMGGMPGGYPMSGMGMGGMNTPNGMYNPGMGGAGMMSPALMEAQMSMSHSAMHGQAYPGMSPAFAERLNGEPPVPGTREWSRELYDGMQAQQRPWYTR